MAIFGHYLNDHLSFTTCECFDIYITLPHTQQLWPSIVEGGWPACVNVIHTKSSALKKDDDDDLTFFDHKKRVGLNNHGHTLGSSNLNHTVPIQVTYPIDGCALFGRSRSIRSGRAVM